MNMQIGMVPFGFGQIFDLVDKIYRADKIVETKYFSKRRVSINRMDFPISYLGLKTFDGSRAQRRFPIRAGNAFQLRQLLVHAIS